MDDMPNAAGLPQGPHFPPEPARAVPPLRLLLQPAGMVLELTRPEILMGRHSEADVRLPLPDVSRRHCCFSYRDGQWTVIDLNSLNGVYVNDKPVREAALQAGDLVRVGSFTFRVELPGAVAEPARAEGLAESLFPHRPGVRSLLPEQRRAS